MERSTIVQTSSDDEFTSASMSRQDMVLKSSRLKKLKSQSSVSSPDVKVHSTKRQPIVSDDSDMDAFEAESVERESKDVDKQSTLSISSSSSVISISSASSSSNSVSTLDVDRSASTSIPSSLNPSMSTSGSHSTSSASTSSSTSSLFEQEGNESPVLASPQRRRSHAMIPELPLQRRTSSADDGSLILTVKRSKKRPPSFPAAPPMDGSAEESKKQADWTATSGSVRSQPDQCENATPKKSARMRLSQPFNRKSIEPAKSKSNESSNSNSNESSKSKSINPSNSKPINPSNSKPIESPLYPNPIEPPLKTNPTPSPPSNPSKPRRPTNPPRPSKPSKASKSWKYAPLATSQLLPPRPADSLAIVDLYSYTPPYDQLAIRPASKQQLKHWIEAPIAPSLCILHGPPGSGKVETPSAVNSSDLCFAALPRKTTCFSVSPM